MSNKRLYTYGLIILLVIVNLGLFDKNRLENFEKVVPKNDILGNSAFTGPAFFKISSSSIQNINNRDFFIGDGTSSISANASVSFAVDSITQNIRFGGLVNCNLDTDGDGDLVCGSDATGGMKTEASGAQNLAAATILNFEDVHFSLTASGTTETIVRLDWGSGGPASLSEAETISGNWVNTANPWADNEVIDTLTVTGGVIGANSISGTQTTTGTTTFGDNGDSIIFDASNWDISTLGKADFLSASVSTNFEAVGYASASKYFTIPLGDSALTQSQFGIDDDGFGQFVYRASSSEHVLTDERKITMNIASSSYNTNTSRELMYLYRGITIKRMTCEVSSATSVIINFEDGAGNNTDSLTCGTTRVFDDGSIANAAMTKGESLVLERGTVVGESDFLTITITYVESRE